MRQRAFAVSGHVLLLAWSLAALVLLAGCPRRTESDQPARGPLTISSVKITLQPQEMLQQLGLSEAAAREWVASWIATTPSVTGTASAGSQNHRLSLSLGLGEQQQLDGALEPALLVEVRIQQPGEPEAPQLSAAALTPVARADLEQKAPTVQQAIKKVVDKVLADMSFQSSLVVGSEERLVQALEQTKDVERLAAAVEIAAVRRAQRAFPALVKLLQHPEHEVSDRATGALVAVGDRRAVPHLTRLSNFSDTARLAKLLDAIGTLGGEEARSYLEMVGAGHEDPDIRDLAQQALGRLNRAEAAQGKR